MLRAIIVSPEPELGQSLATALADFSDQIVVTRTVKEYPQEVEWPRILRAEAPDVLFLSFERVSEVHHIIKRTEAEVSGLQVVAIHRVCEAGLLRESMRAGVREFLAHPFDAPSVADALRNVRDELDRSPVAYSCSEEILAFLPSKAGVGTSTLAINVAAAISRQDAARVLLTDLDLNSGMLRFLLQLNNEYSVTDALSRCMNMDHAQWQSLVTKRENMDVLHAGTVNPSLRIEPSQIHNLVQFMRRNYQALCFDLSGNLERYAMEVMREATKILMVCTPEVPSLHLAREKIAYLKAQGLDGRIAVLLNRMTKKTLLDKAQTESLLGVPVLKVFSNDYLAVGAATTSGKLLNPRSVIARQCAEFATSLVHKPAAGPRRPGHKFLEFFSVQREPRELVAKRAG